MFLHFMKLFPTFLKLTLIHITVASFSSNHSFNCHSNYYWLHIPKTSSTFCLTLQHICCQEKFETIIDGITTNQLIENSLLKNEEQLFSVTLRSGCALIQHKKKGSTMSNCPHVRSRHHKPVPPSHNLQQNPGIVILREPKSRLISAFLDGQHHEGMNSQDFTKLQSKMFPFKSTLLLDNTTNVFGFENNTDVNSTVFVNTLQSLVYALKVYAHEPAMTGCQTKMILGYDCADSNFTLSRTVINETAIQAAVAKLREFFFVGIFEEYKTTLELFYEMTSNQSTSKLGPKMSPSIFELIQTRRGDHVRASVLSKYLSDYQDPYDAALYEEGRKIFYNAANTYLRSLLGFSFPSSHELK